MSAAVERWQPSGRDPLDEARQRRTRLNGVLVLRSDSNWLWGGVSAWMLFGSAALWFNGATYGLGDSSMLSDLLWPIDFLFAASLFSHMALFRSHVRLSGGVATVVNPFRTYTFSVCKVEDLELGFCGFPIITLGNRRIYLMGLQEPLHAQMRGGLEGLLLFQAEVLLRGGSLGERMASARRYKKDYRLDTLESEGALLKVSWGWPGKGAVALLFSWLVFGLTFIPEVADFVPQ